MKIQKIVLSAVCLVAPLCGYSAHLLSDNVMKTGIASYPGDSSQVGCSGVIRTGASYEFLVDDAAVVGLGATDPDMLKFGTERLFDGYNERVGNTAVYGAWHSSYGATVLIDLRAAYSVKTVSASLRTSGRRGAATFIAEVSEDGDVYKPLGTWNQENTVLDSAEVDDPGRNVEVVISASAPVAARYVKVYLSHWDEAHTTRKLNQLVIGELVVWGDELAE